MYSKKQARALPVVVALLAVAACGGNGNNTSQPPPRPPVVEDPPLPVPQADTTAIIGSDLVTFNRTRPGTIASTMTITGITAGEVILGGDFRPATGLYYVLTSASAIYEVEPTTGAASIRLPMTDASGAAVVLDTTPGATFGVDFDPVLGRLRVTSSGNGQNLRVSVADGTTIVDGNLTVAGAPAGASEVAYSNNFGSACRTTSFYIDPAGDRLLTTIDPNGGVLDVVGSLGVDATGASGFEIISTADSMGAITNTAIATLTVGGNASLYNIDLTTGAATAVGALASGGATPAVGLSVVPTARGPANAVGELIAVNVANNLISFNSAAPGKLCTTFPVTGLALDEFLFDLDVRPADGQLYALSSAAKIYTVVPTTGVATLVSTLTVPLERSDSSLASFSIDFDPVSDRLRVVSDRGQNLRVDVTTGATIVDGRIASTSINSIAYTNAIAGTVTTRLLDIDIGNNLLTVQNPPNDGTVASIGPLGFDAQAVGGFDIDGLTNQAFAVLGVSNNFTARTLYTVNLATGAIALVTTPEEANNIGGGTFIRGMALSSAMMQASKATVVAVTSGNRIVNFSPATPGTTSAPLAIAGLPAGENIIGIDQRPSSRVIYASSDANKLYTLALTFNAPVAPAVVGTIATATVTPVGATGALRADPTDTTAPFAALSGTSFGLDFNPTADCLRVTSDATQNSCIHVANGQTSTDGNLNGVMSPLVAASAHSNNFAGAPTTRLFDIDPVTATLLVQNPISSGALTPVGTGLGVGPFTTTASFDIVGGDNTFALATLQLSGMGSGLYLINTTTGTATRQPLDVMGAPANVIGGSTPLVITAATIVLQ